MLTSTVRRTLHELRDPLVVGYLSLLRFVYTLLRPGPRYEDIHRLATLSNDTVNHREERFTTFPSFSELKPHLFGHLVLYPENQYYGATSTTPRV